MENNNALTMVENMNNKDNIMFISFEPESLEDKKMVYEATTNGTSLREVVNKTIKIQDVIVTPSEVTNDNGETSLVPRISIITTEGEIYIATSWGIYNCLNRINSIFGTLHFDEGLAVTPYQVTTKKGFTMNLKIE